jgi:hypothetical protein
MNNITIQLKVKERLNKLDSQDFDNLQAWQIIEAFNKGQVDWCRRNLHGNNLYKTGDEGSKRRIDDMQILLSEVNINLAKKDLYFESPTLPADYFEWKRISARSKTDCCDNRRMVIYLAEEANVDTLLRDQYKKPSYEWGETFCTLNGGKVRIYTNNEFDIASAKLTYYRQPRYIQIAGVVNPYTNLVSAVDVESEFKDDIVEVLIDEAAKIIAGDIESINQISIQDNSVENNN